MKKKSSRTIFFMEEYKRIDVIVKILWFVLLIHMFFGCHAANLKSRM